MIGEANPEVSDMDNYKGTALRKPVGPKDVQGASYWCVTKRKRYHASLTWEIKDFKRCAANRDILKSTPIIAENDPEKTEWHLKCYPGGKRSEYSEYIGLYLHSETRDIDFYYGDVEFSIIDVNGQKRFCYEYKDYNIAGEKAMVGLHDYVKRSKLLEEEDVLLPNNTLTLFFKLSLCSSPESEGGSDATECSTTLSLDCLSQDLAALLNSDSPTLSKIFSDVTLVVDGKEFHAHRNILAARSSVFMAMFEHPMQESVDSRVEIVDISADVLGLFLRVLYTGKFPEDASDETFLAILPVADKYNVASLKQICEQNLSNAISIDNACQVLVLSYLHGCENLKLKTLDFVAIHGKLIMASSEWKEIEKNYPALLAEAFRALANKYIPDSNSDSSPPKKKRKLKTAW